jgi:hypothetical protein
MKIPMEQEPLVRKMLFPLDANRATSVYSTDLDGDGDMDVLSSSFGDNKIAWYENDGTGNFGSQIVISTAASGAYSVYATDMDGDGDMDVLSASWTDNKIAWYENTDGAGTFGAQNVISTVAMNAVSVYATDMDGDGDMDVVSASNRDDKIAWYEKYRWRWNLLGPAGNFYCCFESSFCLCY